jgi:hypothetical protein
MPDMAAKRTRWSATYHFAYHPTDPWAGACGIGPLEYGTESTAESVPEHLRCHRGGCFEQWAELDARKAHVEDELRRVERMWV